MNEEMLNETIPTTTAPITIGAFLKKEREERSLSLRNIADQTKIHYTLLEHLENDRIEKLPQRTYVTGFIKAYAKVLGAPQADALAILEYTYNLKFPKQHHQDTHIETSKTKLEVTSVGDLYTSSKKKISLTVGGFFLICIALFLVINSRLTTTTTQEKSATEVTKEHSVIQSVVNPITQGATEPAVTPSVSEDRTSDKILETKTQEIIVEKIVPKEEKIVETSIASTKQVETIIQPPAIKPTPKAVEVIFDSQKNTDNKVAPPKLPTSETPIMKNQKQNILIQAIHGDSWITYKVDNDRVKKYVLTKGSYLRLKGQEVLVFLGNVNATKISADNQTVETTTTSGVKSLVFPAENQKKYNLPLFIYHADGTVSPSLKQ